MRKCSKIIAIALCLCFVVATLAGCGSTDKVIGTIANKTSGAVTDINLLHYLFNAYYAHINLEYNVAQFNQQNSTKTTLKEQLAQKSTEDNTKTYNQIYTEQLTNETIETIILLSKFNELGMQMDSAAMTDAQSYAASIKSQMGDVIYTNFRRAMQLTETEMKDFLMEIYKTGVVKEHYFGEGKEFGVTEAEVKKQFDEGYARVKHILIKNTDDLGNKLTDDKLQEAKNKVDDLKTQAENGADFDKLARYNSQDQGGPDKPENTEEVKPTYTLSGNFVVENYGYTIAKDGSMVPEFENAAFDMKVGEVKVVESSYGWHIMKKYDHNEVPEIYTQLASTIESELDQEKYEAQMKVWKEEYNITVDNDILNKHSLINLKNIIS